MEILRLNFFNVNSSAFYFTYEIFLENEEVEPDRNLFKPDLNENEFEECFPWVSTSQQATAYKRFNEDFYRINFGFPIEYPLVVKK